jgi:uroporphyrinogen III methyltransferase/synthase
MGVKNLALIADRLTAAGRDPQEPVAVVERGTHPGQRTLVDTLAGIAARVEAEGVRPPAITLVGQVAGLHETIAWLERRPLHGEVVAVTRARAQASGLAVRLRELGAEVVETPAIRIEPRPLEGAVLDAVRGIREYALVCLTSPNGVRLLFDGLVNRPGRACARRRDDRGDRTGTAAELERADCAPMSCPSSSWPRRSWRRCAGVRSRARRVLVARAAEARDVLPDALRERGAGSTMLALYETVAEPLATRPREGSSGPRT